MSAATMILVPVAWLVVTAGLAYTRAPAWSCHISGILAACIALVVTQ